MVSDIINGVSWHFEKNPNITRNPDIEIESFRRLDISEMLVREVIQNSLDAKLAGNSLGLLFSFHVIEKDSIQEYLGSLQDHLIAERIPPTGKKVLPDEVIENIEKSPLMDILCIEDHGTTGLDGTVTEGNIISDSNYDSFFRGEGVSGKDGVKGGRWGQGKTTINMASRIRSFWGLTTRHSDKRQLLMGKSLLYPHLIGEIGYVYHGLYSGPNSIAITDKNFLQRFKRRIKCRRNEEPGLSLIIPYPVTGINQESIVKAAIIHYFYPIVKGDLDIKIYNFDNTFFELNYSSLIKISESLDWSNTSWYGRGKQYILSLLQFSKESVEIQSKEEMIVLPDIVASTYTISEYVLHEAGNYNDLKYKFNLGTTLGFKIPINITDKDGNVTSSHFVIFIKKYLDEDMRGSDEHYIRSGISLPEERGKLGIRPVRGIFVAEDTVISEFLGDAEVPAHTSWNERREGFADKYQNHRRTLRFIRNAMSEIVVLLDQVTNKRDFDLLDHIFYIPEVEDETEPTEPEKTKKDKDSKESLFEPPPPTSKDFVISQIENGISIKPRGYQFPISGKIRLAYDVLSGNPFSGHERFDFDLSTDSSNIKLINGDFIRREENIIWFTFRDRRALFSLTGFDPNRDLIIRITKEVE